MPNPVLTARLPSDIPESPDIFAPLIDMFEVLQRRRRMQHRGCSGNAVATRQRQPSVDDIERNFSNLVLDFWSSFESFRSGGLRRT
eukprot:503283-Prymnesium_polylepis.1